jgi:hypothetical protein
MRNLGKLFHLLHAAPVFIGLLLFLTLTLTISTTQSHAQTPVAITATVTGANTAPFVYGTYQVQLVDSNNAPLNNIWPSPTRFSGSFDSYGKLALSLYPNSSYAPPAGTTGTFWQFQLCSAPTAKISWIDAHQQCYSSLVTITAAGDYSSAISTGAPAIYYQDNWYGEIYAAGIDAANITLTGPGCGAGTYAKSDGTGCGAGGGGGSSVGTAGQVQKVGSTAGSLAASSATDNGTTFQISEPLTLGVGGAATQMATTCQPVSALVAASTVPPVVTGSNTTNTFTSVCDGTTSVDCTAGGGSNLHWCFSNGSAWVSSVPTVTGLADPGANGIVKRTSLGVTAAATVGTDYMSPATAVLAAQMPALTGDCTSSAGAIATNCAHAFSTLTDSSSVTWTTGAAISNAVLTGAHTTSTRAINLASLAAGDYGTLIFKQDSTGSANITGGTGCTWYVTGSSGYSATSTFFSVAPSAGAVDIITWTYDGGNCYANVH